MNVTFITKNDPTLVLNFCGTHYKNQLPPRISFLLKSGNNFSLKIITHFQYTPTPTTGTFVGLKNLSIWF